LYKDDKLGCFAPSTWIEASLREAAMEFKGKGWGSPKATVLSSVFPESENVGLRHIWKWGSADLIVYRHGKLICLIESGGSHHWEEKQSPNDRRKWKLAEIIGIRCLTRMNGMMGSLFTGKIGCKNGVRAISCIVKCW
jgi:hypothetical protein